MYLTDRADVAPVGEVHGEWFRDIRPASTAVVVAALIDPSLLVEIEADARRARRLGRGAAPRSEVSRGRPSAPRPAPAR